MLSRQLTQRTTVALDQLADALDAGQSDALTALLRAMSALDQLRHAISRKAIELTYADHLQGAFGLSSGGRIQVLVDSRPRPSVACSRGRRS